MPENSGRTKQPFDPEYSITAPHRYRLDIPGGPCRDSIKTAIGMAVFTVSLAAFALGVYLASGAGA